MVQEIKLNQIDTVVTTVGTPWTDGNLPTEKAVRDAITNSSAQGIVRAWTITRNIADVSNTEVIAHWLWITPKYVKFYYAKSLWAAWDVGDVWIRDGANNKTLGTIDAGSGTDHWFDATKCIRRWAAGWARFLTWEVTSADSTNFSISWVKTGSPTGTLYVFREAYA